MNLRSVVRSVAFVVLHPLRLPISWACQRGHLPNQLRHILPWRWVLEPFTIYGSGWTCKWQPTEFDSIAHILFWSGLREWERETIPVMLGQIRDAHCFIDIGANCGIYSVLGALVNPNVRVFAVEPVQQVYDALCKNIEVNNLTSRVVPLNIALGNINGRVPFHHAKDATMSSLSVAGYRGQMGDVVEVRCRTLDSLVDELNVKPDFLKIDVEGFEYVVLDGARHVLDAFRPRMVIEANPGDDNDLVTSILLEYRYRFRHITDRGLECRSHIFGSERHPNWLCEPV